MMRVSWLPPFHPVVEEAIDQLMPEQDFRRELFRLLIEDRGSARKKTALVMEGEDPVAVIGIRKRYSLWEPVAQWIVPGMLFPGVRDRRIDAVAALGLPVRVGWWRMKEPAPNHRLLRNIEAVPTHRINLAGDYERPWRESGYLKKIRNIRRRCQALEFRVNDPGKAEETIRKWAVRWTYGIETRMPDINDRIAVAKFLEGKGAHFTMTLHDGERMVAGTTFVSHGDCLVGQVNWRDLEYERHGVGTRLLDLAARWAADRKYRKMDIGSTKPYKFRWCSQEGMKISFLVCPPYRIPVFRVAEFTWQVWWRIVEWVGRNPRGNLFARDRTRNSSGKEDTD